MLIQASASHGPIHTDPTFWVAICVLAFLSFLFFKGVHKVMGTALDARSTKISEELAEARRLREEAQTLLASYKRKQKEAEDLAEDIVKQARHDAELMAVNARKDMAERLERRTAAAEAKIKSAEVQALNEVRAKAADVSLKAAEALLRNDLKSPQHANLIKDGIAQMGKVLG